jgi:O-acetyl-ADP-ribose deacetylase (regulator of RNase III)
MMETRIGGTTLEILQGDITEMDTTAIVNAANDRLILGAGVAGAIKAKGGPDIQKECNELGGTYVGGAVVTTGGNLKADYVIHAVGPRMGEGNEDQKLADAVRNSLTRADEKNMQSVAFPAISTGIFGFPMERAADIMIKTAAEYLENHPTTLQKVLFCLYGQEAYDIFAQAFKRLLPDHTS